MPTDAPTPEELARILRMAQALEDMLPEPQTTELEVMTLQAVRYLKGLVPIVQRLGAKTPGVESVWHPATEAIVPPPGGGWYWLELDNGRKVAAEFGCATPPMYAFGSEVVRWSGPISPPPPQEQPHASS